MSYKFSYWLVLIATLCASLWPASAAAQTGGGTVAGTAKDSGGAVLSSALIELQPLGKKVVSDDQGQFRMTDVPVGEYTLTASYVGLATFSTTVKVDAGQTATIDP